MRTFDLVAPCHFGLESVLKREIYDLGYEIKSVEDGRVTFIGDDEAIARANIGLRTAERVMIKIGGFHAETFEELFQNTKAIDIENYVPRNGRFWVTKASSIKSKLFSPSDIQSVMKKAMAVRMGEYYKTEWLSEDGESFPIRVFIMKDEVTVCLDTTGDSLHKRGYRKLASKAPIAENLGAALLMLTPWNKDRILVDPFCGSGTFPIEAALMAAGIAPGVNRRYTAMNWEHLVNKSVWNEAIEEAKSLADYSVRPEIIGYDIDPEMIKIANANAKLAGVSKMVNFVQRDVSELSHNGEYGFIVTNPPYGERLEEKSALPALYKTISRKFTELPTWSLYMITSYENAENDMGRKADKNRKIYNGMIKTYFYQYMGPRPPKKNVE